MTDKERQEFLELIRKRTEDMVRNKDKKRAREVLYAAGIITKKGEIRKGREGSCMLLGRRSSLGSMVADQRVYTTPKF